MAQPWIDFSGLAQAQIAGDNIRLNRDRLEEQKRQFEANLAERKREFELNRQSVLDTQAKQEQEQQIKAGQMFVNGRIEDELMANKHLYANLPPQKATALAFQRLYDNDKDFAFTFDNYFNNGVDEARDFENMTYDESVQADRARLAGLASPLGVTPIHRTLGRAYNTLGTTVSEDIAPVPEGQAPQQSPTHPLATLNQNVEALKQQRGYTPQQTAELQQFVSGLTSPAVDATMSAIDTPNNYITPPEKPLINLEAEYWAQPNEERIRQEMLAAQEQIDAEQSPQPSDTSLLYSIGKGLRTAGSNAVDRYNAYSQALDVGKKALMQYLTPGGDIIAPGVEVKKSGFIDGLLGRKNKTTVDVAYTPTEKGKPPQSKNTKTPIATEQDVKVAISQPTSPRSAIATTKVLQDLTVPPTKVVDVMSQSIDSLVQAYNHKSKLITGTKKQGMSERKLTAALFLLHNPAYATDTKKRQALGAFIRNGTRMDELDYANDVINQRQKIMEGNKSLQSRYNTQAMIDGNTRNAEAKAKADVIKAGYKTTQKRYELEREQLKLKAAAAKEARVRQQKVLDNFYSDPDIQNFTQTMASELDEDPSIFHTKLTNNIINATTAVYGTVTPQTLSQAKQTVLEMRNYVKDSGWFFTPDLPNMTTAVAVAAANPSATPEQVYELSQQVSEYVKAGDSLPIGVARGLALNGGMREKDIAVTLKALRSAGIPESKVISIINAKLRQGDLSPITPDYAKEMRKHLINIEAQTQQ